MRIRLLPSSRRTTRWRLPLLTLMLPLLAACAQTVEHMAKEQEPPKGETLASTPEEIKTQCWMRYEGTQYADNLDAKIKLVDRCVEEQGRTPPPAR